jgi:2'-5' RNA ligase superfamily
VKATQYCVVAFPKLDNEAQFQRLREKFDPWPYRVRPYIPVVLPFTPADLDEIQNVSDHVSTARRTLHPLAITLHECVERGEYLCFSIEQGRDHVVELHRRILGSEPLPLLHDTTTYEPLLWLCQVSDPARRTVALAEANGVGRSLGIIDALSIIRLGPSEDLKIVAVFPFGIGRVDFYERLTG